MRKTLSEDRSKPLENEMASAVDFEVDRIWFCDRAAGHCLRCAGLETRRAGLTGSPDAGASEQGEGVGRGRSQANGWYQKDAARRDVLKPPSDAEITGVSAVETTPRPWDGGECLDLERLDEGVLRARRTAMSMPGLLPRGTVPKETWSRILELLARAT
jgi:hypothetical protein